MKRWTLSAGAALLLGAAPALANDSVLGAAEDPNQWVQQLGNYSGQRYSELDQINKENVGDLQVAWTFSTGVLRGHEGSPLVIGNMMYVHTPFPNIVYALDLNQDGRIVWKYSPVQDPNVIGVMCCDTVYRGLAYADDTIFLHQADTTLVALDAKTGEVKWSVKNGDPAKGETNTATVLPVKDKVLVGISGGEYGVRGMSPPTTSRTARWPGAPTRPGRTRDAGRSGEDHALGKPIGTNSSLDSWEGDQWQIGGGTTWGWYSYDPELDLIYYGTGNPSTWNPAQRPGDNKYSMTIFARDPDDGMAKWLYQMTPHDEWDFDGVNEMVLFEAEVDGTERKLLFHPDRNGLAYTLDRDTGELLVAEKYDPAVNWTTGVDMDPNSETFGRPAVVRGDLDRAERRGRQHHRRLPGGARHQGPAALGLLAEDRADVRADQPRLHGLRAVPGQLHRRPALCRGDAVDVPGAGQPRRHGQLHRLGSGRGRDQVVAAGAVLGLVGRAGDRGRRGLLRHARGLPEGGRLRDRRGALQVQDAVGDHRQRLHLHPQRQAVRRRAVGCRRLGGHRPRGRA